jgi:anthranilate synthase component 2
MTRILVIDNYDSFTYNLVHLLESFEGIDCDVVKNDAISLDKIADYQRIILSPGPGLPAQAGIMPALLQHYASTHIILGVCLGHQAIAEAFGAQLHNLPQVVHGRETPVQIIRPDAPLFRGISSPFQAGRYHSWVVSSLNLPPCLIIDAIDENGQIMALSHRDYPLHSIQFHPESVMTPQGRAMLWNWLFHVRCGALPSYAPS